MKKRIMRRVYAIWFTRQIAPALFVQLPFFAILAAREIAREFFVANIMQSTGAALRSGHNPISMFLGLFVNGIRDTHTVPLLVILLSSAVIAVLLFKVAANMRAIFSNKTRYPMRERAF